MAPKSDVDDNALNNSARMTRTPKDAGLIYDEDVRGGYIAPPLKEDEPYATVVEQFVFLGGDNYQTGHLINRINWASGAREKYKPKRSAVARRVKPGILCLDATQGNGKFLDSNSCSATTQPRPKVDLAEVTSNNGPKQPDTAADPDRPMAHSSEIDALGRKRSDTEAENPLFCARVKKYHNNCTPYRPTLPNGQHPGAEELPAAQTLRNIFESSQPTIDYEKPLIECLPLAAGIDANSIDVFSRTWPIYDAKVVHGIAKSHEEFFDKLQQVHVPKGTVHWIMRGCTGRKPTLDPQVDPDKPIDGPEGKIRHDQAEEKLHNILRYHPLSRLQEISNAEETDMGRERSTAASRYSYVPSFLNQGEIETSQLPHSSNDIKEFAAEGRAIERNINNTRNEFLKRFCEGSQATLPSSGVSHIELEMDSDEAIHSDVMRYIEDLERQLTRMREESGIPPPPERVTNDPGSLSHDPLSHNPTEEQQLMEKIRTVKQAGEVFGPDFKLPSPPKKFNDRNASSNLDTNTDNSVDCINVVSPENNAPHNGIPNDRGIPWLDLKFADGHALWNDYKNTVTSAQAVGTAIEAQKAQKYRQARNRRITSSGGGPPRKRIRSNEDVQGDSTMGGIQVNGSKLSEPPSVGEALSALPRRPSKSFLASQNSSQLHSFALSTPRESKKEPTYQTPDQDVGPNEASIMDNTPIRIDLPTSSSKKSGRKMVTIISTNVANRIAGMEVIENAAKQHLKTASIKILANFDEEAVEVKVTGPAESNPEEFVRKYIHEEWIQELTHEDNSSSD